MSKLLSESIIDRILRKHHEHQWHRVMEELRLFRMNITFTIPAYLVRFLTVCDANNTIPSIDIDAINATSGQILSLLQDKQKRCSGFYLHKKN